MTRVIFYYTSIYYINCKYTDSRYPKQQGVFAHASDVRNGNTLLLVGGYHGNVNADLLAYTLPPMLAPGDNDNVEPEQICARHKSLVECAANPECGWCSADEVYYINLLFYSFNDNSNYF